VLNGFHAVKDGLTAHPEEVSGRAVKNWFLVASGIIFSNGRTWKQQRRFGVMTLRHLGMGKKGLEYWVQEEAHHLLQHFASMKEKVQQELDAVLGSSQLICYEDRKKMPYTNAVIHEIQRFSNIIPVGLPRVCAKNTMLLGFPLAKVDRLCSVLYDPEQWETPRQFNPGHFLDKDGNFVNQKAFLPFSAGHRVCLGELLARTELFIFFSNLLRAFTFRLPEGVKQVNIEPILAGTWQPHPYGICAVPR
uniref:Cytochrome P450 2C8-like n=1 Tax=Crocodylus porosus TaxID=8502 RepID=A0A7M4FYQ1_CROPO